MIILQAATTILVAVIAIAFAVDWLVERRGLHEIERELSELEMRELFYPNGNVHLLERHPLQGEAASPNEEKD